MQWNNKRDRAAFLDAFEALCELHNRDASKALAKMYFMSLADLQTDEVVRGIIVHMAKQKWFPKPVEIREAITGPRVDLADIAEVEAGKVLYAIKEIGGHRSVCFDDAVTMAAIRSGFGGWVQLCTDTRIADEKWFRKDFVRIYTAYAKTNVKHFGGLAGQHTIQNSANGLASEEQPALVGDQEKAHQLMLAAKEYVPEQLAITLPLPGLSSMAR